MPGIDETSDRIGLGAASLERLAAVFDRQEVVAAYLVGSQAASAAGPLSDVDVAVWLDPTLGLDQRLDLRIRLVAAATEALSTDRLDLIVLNDAPPLLRHRALGHRRRLVERDAVARVRLEARTIVEYLDTAPLRRELAAGVRRRLEEGRFGRR